MKRMLSALLMFAICVSISLYSIFHIQEVKDSVTGSVARCASAMADSDHAALLREVDDLSSFWDVEEGILVRFVRHDKIDEITKSVAKLRALTQGEAYVDLAAELDSIAWLIDQVNNNERFIFSNLL